MEGLRSAGRGTAPSMVSWISRSLPACRPSRSRTGLGRITRPALSILSVIPFHNGTWGIRPGKWRTWADCVHPPQLRARFSRSGIRYRCLSTAPGQERIRRSPHRAAVRRRIGRGSCTKARRRSAEASVSGSSARLADSAGATDRPVPTRCRPFGGRQTGWRRPGNRSPGGARECPRWRARDRVRCPKGRPGHRRRLSKTTYREVKAGPEIRFRWQLSELRMTRMHRLAADGILRRGQRRSAVSSRSTIEPGKRGGKPCIRGLRITVWDVLGWLGAGMTEEQILDEHPDIEKADFPAVYQFAAEAGRKANLPPG